MALQRLADLSAGKTYTRSDVLRKYFGELQTGISYSKQSKDRVAVISNFKQDKSRGYFYGIADDIFLFCGQGQEGDQVMAGANEVLTKAQYVFLFEAIGANQIRFLGRATYRDHFVVVNKDKNGKERKAIVHRLLPSNQSEVLDVPKVDPVKCNSIKSYVEEVERVEEIAIQKLRQNTTRIHKSNHTSTTIEQREAQLEDEFCKFLKKNGHKVMRLKITPKGCAAPIYSDLATTMFLGEAKGDTSRESIRMAIGQLADYGRFDPNKPKRHRLILLPEEPSRDLTDLLHQQDISLVFRTKSGKFTKSAGSNARNKLW